MMMTMMRRDSQSKQQREAPGAQVRDSAGRCLSWDPGSGPSTAAANVVFVGSSCELWITKGGRIASARGGHGRKRVDVGSGGSTSRGSVSYAFEPTAPAAAMATVILQAYYNIRQHGALR